VSKGGHAREQLVLAVAEILSPRLVELGFQPKGSQSRKKSRTSTQYYRGRDGRFDFVHIEWRSLQRPYFIVEFDSVAIARLPQGFIPTDVKFWEDFVLRYRLSRCKFPERWFGLGLVARVFAPRLAARRVARLARSRLHLMEEFLREGRTSWYVWGGANHDTWAKPESLDDAVVP
jgi:hypothetical protein